MRNRKNKKEESYENEDSNGRKEVEEREEGRKEGRKDRRKEG